MGLSASQARLLHLTSRLSDLELGAQRISNAKIRLAEDSEEASRKYSDALNQQKLTVYDTVSNAYVDANAENLTTYYPGNEVGDGVDSRQRFIKNEAGQMLVTDDVLNAYNASGSNFERFLNNLEGHYTQNTDGGQVVVAGDPIVTTSTITQADVQSGIDQLESVRSSLVGETGSITNLQPGSILAGISSTVNTDTDTKLDAATLEALRGNKTNALNSISTISGTPSTGNFSATLNLQDLAGVLQSLTSTQGLSQTQLNTINSTLTQTNTALGIAQNPINLNGTITYDKTALISTAGLTTTYASAPVILSSRTDDSVDDYHDVRPVVAAFQINNMISDAVSKFSDDLNEITSPLSTQLLNALSSQTDPTIINAACAYAKQATYNKFVYNTNDTDSKDGVPTTGTASITYRGMGSSGYLENSNTLGYYFTYRDIYGGVAEMFGSRDDQTGNIGYDPSQVIDTYLTYFDQYFAQNYGGVCNSVVGSGSTNRAATNGTAYTVSSNLSDTTGANALAYVTSTYPTTATLDATRLNEVKRVSTSSATAATAAAAADGYDTNAQSIAYIAAAAAAAAGSVDRFTGKDAASTRADVATAVAKAVADNLNIADTAKKTAIQNSLQTAISTALASSTFNSTQAIQSAATLAATTALQYLFPSVANDKNHNFMSDTAETALRTAITDIDLDKLASDLNTSTVTTTYSSDRLQGQMRAALSGFNTAFENVGNKFGLDVSLYTDALSTAMEGLAEGSAEQITSDKVISLKSTLTAIAAAIPGLEDLIPEPGTEVRTITPGEDETVDATYDKAAVEYYRNTFNEIQESNGIITADRDYMTDSKWLQTQIEVGTLFLYEKRKTDGVEDFENVSWTSGDNTLKTETDKTMMAKAESEYEAVMALIEAKDQRFDLQLKNIDMEHNAIQTEMESVKKVIEKNIERAFKIFEG